MGAMQGQHPVLVERPGQAGQQQKRRERAAGKTSVTAEGRSRPKVVVAAVVMAVAVASFAVAVPAAEGATAGGDGGVSLKGQLVDAGALSVLQALQVRVRERGFG